MKNCPSHAERLLQEQNPHEWSTFIIVSTHPTDSAPELAVKKSHGLGTWPGLAVLSHQRTFAAVLSGSVLVSRGFKRSCQAPALDPYAPPTKWWHILFQLQSETHNDVKILFSYVADVVFLHLQRGVKSGDFINKTPSTFWYQ